MTICQGEDVGGSRRRWKYFKEEGVILPVVKAERYAMLARFQGGECDVTSCQSNRVGRGEKSSGRRWIVLKEVSAMLPVVKGKQ